MKDYLRKLRDLILRSNEGNTQNPLHLPDLMMVVTATGLAYRDDDVLVIPLTTLKP